MSDEVLIEYDLKKVRIHVVICIIGILLFIWGFLNADLLIRNDGPSTSKYQWIKHVFFDNTYLFKGFCLGLIALFLYILKQLIEKLRSKKVPLSLIGNRLYLGAKSLATVDNIERIELFSYSKNQYIRIFVKNSQDVINSCESRVDKIVAKINSRLYGSPLLISTSYFKESPEDIQEKIHMLIGDRVN